MSKSFISIECQLLNNDVYNWISYLVLYLAVIDLAVPGNFRLARRRTIHIYGIIRIKVVWFSFLLVHGFRGSHYFKNEKTGKGNDVFSIDKIWTPGEGGKGVAGGEAPLLNHNFRV